MSGAVRNRFGPVSKKSGGGAGRLIFTNKASFNESRYVSGSGVGSLNVSVRRALVKRANSRADGTPCGCTKD